MTDEEIKIVERIESDLFSGCVVRLSIENAIHFFRLVSERRYDRHLKIHFNHGFVFIERDVERGI